MKDSVVSSFEIRLTDPLHRKVFENQNKIPLNSITDSKGFFIYRPIILKTMLKRKNIAKIQELCGNTLTNLTKYDNIEYINKFIIQ